MIVVQTILSASEELACAWNTGRQDCLPHYAAREARALPGK